MIPNKEIYYPLFVECVEALDAVILSSEEDMQLTYVFEKCFPITKWGKIAWGFLKKEIKPTTQPEQCFLD